MATLAAGRTIGPYPFRIERQLGNRRGNMAEVHLATAHGPGAPSDYVAIKIARIANQQGEFNETGLHNEVEILPLLTHPSIVRIYPVSPPGAGRLSYWARAAVPGEPIFAVLEYLEGGTLHDLLAQRPQAISARTALEITRQLAAALDYLHLKGFVHMDVKPDNIVFRRQWEKERVAEPVLVDFGVARRSGQEPLGGAIPYMAPERIGGVGGAQPSMDVFALGVVLYIMLAGRLPYIAADDEGMRAEICAGAFRPPSAVRQYDVRPHIVKRTDASVLKALHLDPQQRPTASQLVKEMEEIAHDLAAPDKQPRNWWQVWAAALAGLAAAGALLLATPYPAIFAKTVLAVLPAANTATPTAATPVPKVTAKALAPAAVPAAARATATATARSTATATAIPTATATATPTVTATVSPPPSEPSGVTGVILLSPPDGAVITGETTFSWQPIGSLLSDQAYLVAVWHPEEEDWNKEELNRGLMAPTTDTSAIIDLKRLVEEQKLNVLGRPNVEMHQDIKWGVFLVDRSTGKVLDYLDSEHWIRVE